MPKPFFAALAATAVLAAANGALAASLTSSRVYYGDLDLSTPRDAQLMLKRIHATAEQLCAPIRSPVIVPAQRPADNARCKLEAIQRAVASLNVPLVTAEFEKIQARYPSLFAARN